MNDRIVLNANIGQSNLIEFEQFYEIAVSTLLEISDTITTLCGPNALYDLVVYENMQSGLMSNVFSHDGIHILKSLEYMNPIQTFITSYVKYVAEKVDAAAADGTSTAILLTAEFISQALEVVRQLRSIPDVSVREFMRSIGEFREVVSDVFRHLIRHIDKCKIDLREIDPNLRKRLIYALAYTSSKGDTQLSEYTVEIFAELPELLYEQINMRRNTVETSEPLSIEYPESDAIINITPSGTVQYNAKLNTEWADDHCNFLPIATMLDGVQADIVLQFLETYMERTDKKLVILLSGADETGIMRLERSIDKSRIVLCRMSYYHPLFVNNPTEVRVILAMSGKSTDEPREIADYAAALVHDVKIKLANRSLYVDRLITDNDKLHPFYTDPYIHAPYTKLRLELEAQIKDLKNSHNSKDLRHELDEFSRIYRLMVCSRFPILVIGGSTVEHLALINVVNDVLGVVSIAMKHGVILDLMPKLAIAFDELISKDDLCRNYFRGVRNTIEYFAELTYQTKVSITDELVKYREQYSDDLNCLFFEMDGWQILPDLTKYTDNDTFTVVQSYKAIEETLKRLLETVPKLISVDKILVPNSVMKKEVIDA